MNRRKKILLLIKYFMAEANEVTDDVLDLSDNKLLEDNLLKLIGITDKIKAYKKELDSL